MTDDTGAFYDVGMLWLLIVIAVLVIPVTLFLLRRPMPADFDSGARAARAREEERLARGGAGPSPLGGAQYDESQRALFAPVEAPLDDTIRALTRRYIAADANGRAAMRDALSMDDFATLLAYAGRAAVFGMRRRDRARIDDALTAVAMIDLDRIDPAELPAVLAYIHHASRKLGVETRKAFSAAAAMAASATRGEMEKFLEDYPPGADIREDWDFDDSSGGFVMRGSDSYEPGRDLAKLAADIAILFERDRFVVVMVEIADNLPPVWLKPNDQEAAELLQSSRGSASIHGKTREDEQQTLVAWLVELRDSTQAQRLADLARASSPRDFARLAVAQRNLVCVVIQESELMGGKAEETDESLARFATPIATVLAV